MTLRSSSTPDFAEAFSGRGNTYRMKGDAARAIADLTEAIRLTPDEPFNLTYRGIAYASRGEHDLAIADFDRALRLNPKLALAQRNRMLAGRAKAPDDRAYDYETEIRLNPEKPSGFYHRGNAYMAAREFDLAIADFDRAIQLEPADAAALANRGNALRKRGDYDRAIADYDAALKLDPNFEGARQSRAEAISQAHGKANGRNSLLASKFFSRGLAYSQGRPLRPRHQRIQRSAAARPDDWSPPSITAVAPIPTPETTTARSRTSPVRSNSIRATPRPSTIAPTPI